MPTFTIQVECLTDDWSLLGDGATPADWTTHRYEYVQGLLRRVCEAVGERYPEAEVLATTSTCGRDRVVVDLGPWPAPEAYAAIEARDAREEAIRDEALRLAKEAWMAWSEDL